MVENVRVWAAKWERDGTLKKKPSKHDSLLNHDEIVAALTSKWGSTQVMPELLQSADF
jgi:hypothetical protein